MLINGVNFNLNIIIIASYIIFSTKNKYASIIVFIILLGFELIGYYTFELRCSSSRFYVTNIRHSALINDNGTDVYEYFGAEDSSPRHCTAEDQIDLSAHNSINYCNNVLLMRYDSASRVFTSSNGGYN